MASNVDVEEPRSPLAYHDIDERRAHGWIAIAIIAGAALATRAVTFGNPLVDMDDQFYWLVGQSWWDGRWPIVDIWDRKPVGLFLIYAAIAGIDRSILAVQLTATLFAAATAILIRAASLYIASKRAALFAALTYLMFLPVFGGQSGQSPVFYNLLVAAAALLLLKAGQRGEPDAIERNALGAMLLSGLALVIKQVSIAEGIYFGLAFLYLMRRSGLPNRHIARSAVAMMVIALLPTALGIALFSVRGEGAVSAYVQASYLSIFAKASGAGYSLAAGLTYLLLFGGALFVAAAFGLAARPGDSKRLSYGLVAGWVIAAFVGYLLVPNFFPHYALPLLVPLSIMASRAFDRPIGGMLFIALAATCLLTGRLTDNSRNRRAAADFRHLVATINQTRKDGCLYVANGPVGLYTAVPDCRATPYLFPYHLTLATEGTAVGTDQSAEIERIFAARPAVVVTQDDKRPRQSKAVQASLNRHLTSDYRLIGRIPSTATGEIRTVRVWQRADLRAQRPD